MKYLAIHSVPRSGSTWLGSIFDSSPHVAYRYQPLFSYTHKSQLTPASSKDQIDSFFKDIYKTGDAFVLQKKAIEEGLVPEFEKKNITHICYKEVRYHHILRNILESSDKIILIGLVRNPFSVLNSWIHAPKEFRSDLGWSVDEEWKSAPKKNLDRPEEFNGYLKWKEACYIFLDLEQRFPDQFYLLNYDDLIANTRATVKKLFQFCELDFREQTQDFIQNSIAVDTQDAYSVFKKKKHDRGWKKALPDHIQQEIFSDPDFIQLNQKFKWL